MKFVVHCNFVLLKSIRHQVVCRLPVLKSSCEVLCLLPRLFRHVQRPISLGWQSQGRIDDSLTGPVGLQSSCKRLSLPPQSLRHVSHVQSPTLLGWQSQRRICRLWCLLMMKHEEHSLGFFVFHRSSPGGRHIEGQLSHSLLRKMVSPMRRLR